MKLSSILSALLFICLILNGCERPEGGIPTDVSPTESTPEIRVDFGNTEAVQLEAQEVSQQNCAGTADVENEIQKSHTLEHTLESTGEMSVNTNGQIGFAGTDVELGVTVAKQLGLSYGSAENITKSITVKAKPGTNMLHVIKLTEIWKLGNGRVRVGNQQITVPFRFRNDFVIELVSSRDLGCNIETPSVTPPSQSLSMEERLHTVIASSSGDEDPSIGAFASYQVSSDVNQVGTYTFKFDLPVYHGDPKNSPGALLEFQLNDQTDLSEYPWVMFTIQFCQEGENIDLFLIDTDNHKARFPIPSMQLNTPIEMSLRLDQFLDEDPDLKIDLHKVTAVSLYTNSSKNTGHHEIAISNIRFVKEMASGAEDTNQPYPLRKTLFVFSNPFPFKSTGIRVHAGEVITISAEGGWDCGRQSPVGPEGYPERYSDTVLPTEFACSLIGAISSTRPDENFDQYFRVGSEMSLTVQEAGTLYLGCNDSLDRFPDNPTNSMLKVTVGVEP